MNIYFDPKNPAGFSGAANFQRVTGLPKKEIDEFLRSQEAYTLHAPVRKRFERNFYKVSSIDDTWQADLCDMRHLAKENDGNNYLLTVIDVLSKYAWVQPLKAKDAESVKKAFEIITKKRQPRHLMTDKGKEFVNAKMKNFYKERNINFYTSNNPDIKAGVAERFNRTLKTRMWRFFTHNKTNRYIDVLQDFLRAYNNSYHSSIKMSPVKALSNEKEAWNNLYEKKIARNQKPRFAVGDHVRISREKGLFEKGFDQNWSREIFIIKEILKRQRVIYKLTDLDQEPIEGTFYEVELQKVNLPEKYAIEKILRRKGNKYFVKWQGYPEKFNSWILASDLK
jgi:hypothetical protein